LARHALEAGLDTLTLVWVRCVKEVAVIKVRASGGGCFFFWGCWWLARTCQSSRIREFSHFFFHLKTFPRADTKSEGTS
jgi:hypothetical protein